MIQWNTYRDRLLRHCWHKGMSEMKLADLFGVDVSCIRQRIIELKLTNRKHVSGEEKFVRAMLKARREGLEHFQLGVVKEAGTQHPHLRAVRPAFISSQSALAD